MNQTKPGNPREGSWNPARLARAFDLVDTLTHSGRLPAAEICVGGSAGVVKSRGFGRMGPEEDAEDVQDNTLFLVASITKPIVATAALLLIERGDVLLDDPVASVLPEFGRNGKAAVSLRHLLTHTSGLPDMLPNNIALRAAHAPLSRFVEAIYELPLAFPPGTQVRYQSMGFAILAAVVERITESSIAEFLRREVFEPLGMMDTSLGMKEGTRHRIAAIRLEGEQVGTNWHWNSPYWLAFGAPWGGLITSARDLARFCRMMLGGGALEGVRVLSLASVRLATSNQLKAMPQLPEVERKMRPWGLGWRLNWLGSSANFGDLLGPRAYGHWGATGTLFWIDPDADAFLVLLTTQPGGEDGRELARISNAVAAALGE
jgi:CubicO group peptidase (beta-lactamase class C family)